MQAVNRQAHSCLPVDGFFLTGNGTERTQMATQTNLADVDVLARPD
jgi:hypothetical protein